MHPGNISKFAEPGKVEINEFIIPETPEGIFNLLIDFLGLRRCLGFFCNNWNFCNSYFNFNFQNLQKLTPFRVISFLQ